jgi:hypothetical protein
MQAPGVPADIRRLHPQIRRLAIIPDGADKEAIITVSDRIAGRYAIALTLLNLQRAWIVTNVTPIAGGGP